MHTHMNESQHAYHWVMALIHMNVSGHTSRSRGSSSKSMSPESALPRRYEPVACTWESWHRSMSHITHMSMSHGTHMWMCHGTHMSKSWHSYAWVMAQIWMSHGIHTHDSWHTYEWVMAHIFMSPVTHTNKSWHTCEWVITHIWTSHVTHMYASWHTYTCATSPEYETSASLIPWILPKKTKKKKEREKRSGLHLARYFVFGHSDGINISRFTKRTLWNVHNRNLQVSECDTPQHTLQHTATHCNTLQHTATHCNTAEICRFQNV